MDTAYIDQQQNQAICCWDAPDRKSIDELFGRARVVPEMIREVIQFQG